MRFIVKLFPEITIKSDAVRRRFTRQLRHNLKARLSVVDPDVSVSKSWDHLSVTSALATDEARERVVRLLASTPGIAVFLEVEEHPLEGVDAILPRVQRVYGEALRGKTFAVRCKRSGRHDFRSPDVERAVGAGLLQTTGARGVDLTRPDVTVALEIRDDRLYVVRERHEGLGGFPLGTVEPVLSLMSGGFDSAVASYLTMRRGMLTHFLFFNLGGRAHEVAVKEIAYYLWARYGTSHRVCFVTVPFEGVVTEILTRVDSALRGVVLKRLMLRAAEAVAESLEIQALVTGESVAQVSSQTLTNLSVINAATDMLVLRPLVTMDKRDIIDTARTIGTEPFSRHVPEYCGVTSRRPSTRARRERVESEEARMDPAVLDAAIAGQRCVRIDRVAADVARGVEPVPVAARPEAGDTVIDIRHPDERGPNAPADWLAVPFYELDGRFASLPPATRYLLYCDRGVLSRLHAGYLREEGHANVAVLRPKD